MPNQQDSGASLRILYAGAGGTKSAFTEKVADYVASRPDYPATLFQTLKQISPPCENALVADIGAGTGLLTRDLLKNGYRVVAVEPNPAMRQAADSLLGNTDGYRSVDGCAESMPLSAGSVQLITAAQAFHWFEADRARTEFLRVLTAQGNVALVWNDWVPTDPVRVAFDQISQEFGGAKRAALQAHEDRQYVPHFFGVTVPKQFTWPHAHFLDEAGLISLVFSRSYIPDRATPEGQMVLDRVRALFNRFAVNGKVEVRYNTVAIIGRPG
jgi:SAM-dependent methyltransferase